MGVGSDEVTWNPLRFYRLSGHYKRMATRENSMSLAGDQSRLCGTMSVHDGGGPVILLANPGHNAPWLVERRGLIRRRKQLYQPVDQLAFQLESTVAM